MQPIRVGLPCVAYSCAALPCVAVFFLRKKKKNSCARTYICNVVCRQDISNFVCLTYVCRIKCFRVHPHSLRASPRTFRRTIVINITIIHSPFLIHWFIGWVNGRTDGSPTFLFSVTTALRIASSHIASYDTARHNMAKNATASYRRVQ